MEVIQDLPLPMAEDFHSKNYLAMDSSRFLSQIEMECLTQSMEVALKKVAQSGRKRRKSRVLRYFNPSLEEIKEHAEEVQEPTVDLSSLHRERAMNEGHFTRRGSRKSRSSKPDRNWVIGFMTNCIDLKAPRTDTKSGNVL